jgi:trigger factor
MPPAVKTSTTELGDSRVRVDVEVEPQSVDKVVDRAAKELARDMKLPGFRKGKVPPQVVLQRVGREAVLDEALRSALPEWYEEAVAEAGLAPVGEPKLDMSGLPEKGDRLSFTIEVGVRPTATLGDWKGVEAARREPEAAAEAVDAELERMRDAQASLEPVERSAQAGDFVVIDYLGKVDGEAFAGGEGRGQTIELGSGRLIPGFEDQLIGAAPGEERELNVTFPDDYGAEELAGKEAVFETTVREVREKKMPELNDEFALEAGGFDTVDELRADIEQRLREADERSIEREFREAAVDAAVDTATIDLPKQLVHSKAHDLWHQMTHRMRHQGIDPAQYVAMTGKDEHDLIDEAEPDAERALRREAVLAAIVESEGIKVSDDELIESLRGAGTSADDAQLLKAIDKLRADGRDRSLREDVAMRKAVDLIVDNAKPVDPGRAEAREKLWTPGKAEKAPS